MKTSQKLRAALKSQGHTYQTAADALGVTLRSVHNAACDNAKSKSLRQRLTNLCGGVQIWPGILPLERVYVFPIGCELHFASLQEARAAAVEMADYAELRGKKLIFRKPAPVAIHLNNGGKHEVMHIAKIAAASDAATSETWRASTPAQRRAHAVERRASSALRQSTRAGSYR